MKQTVRDDLNRLLNKHGFSSVMTVNTDDSSGWLFPFGNEALAICKQANAHFAFIEDQKMQAVAIQDEGVDVVVMYAGMFWMLCRLAAVIAGSGVFTAMKGENEPVWKPDLEKSLQTPRKLLVEGTPFNWEQESGGWKNDPERQMLFYVALSILFRFVLFHEIGHLQNDHGRRRAKSSLPMMIDAMSPFLWEPKKAIPSQACEIIADNFALKMTLQMLDHELSLKADLEMTKILRDKLMPDQEALTKFALEIIYLYFRLSDRSDWQQVPIDRLSHPPAPFRMKTLMAAMIEHRHLDISNEAMQLAKEVEVVGDAVMSVILEVYPNPHWLQMVSTPEHDQHYERIFQELPNWRGRMPGSVNP